jgi:hypothetical protein
MEGRQTKSRSWKLSHDSESLQSLLTQPIGITLSAASKLDDALRDHLFHNVRLSDIVKRSASTFEGLAEAPAHLWLECRVLKKWEDSSHCKLPLPDRRERNRSLSHRRPG